MTSTVTPEAARFRAEVEVPDPPPSPKGRSRYWDDTVTDAVAELRKRLREGGTRSDTALVMIIDLEKTRIRHGQYISGTFVPCLPDLDDDWGNPLPAVCPDPPPVCREASPSAPADALGDASRQTEPPPTPPKPTRPLSLAERVSRQNGVIAHFHDHDDDWKEEAHYYREPGDG